MTSKDITDISHSEEPSPLLDLPIEIWQAIISHLGIPVLKKLRLALRFFNEIVRIPLISQSRMLITPNTINDLKREFLQNQEFWPFHTIEILRILIFDEDLRNILEKCTTKYLQSFKIYNANVFEWLAMKPMPTLKELYILWTMADFEDLILPKNWHLKIYKNLKKLSVLFVDRESAAYPEILRLLCDAGATLPLRELCLSYFDHYDSFVSEIFKIHADTLDFIELDLPGQPTYVKIRRGSKLYEELRTKYMKSS